MDDIFYVDYGTDWANDNFNSIGERYLLFVRRIKPVNSLEELFKLTASISTTDNFWIIDSRIKLYPSFKLESVIPDWDEQYVHTWKVFSDYSIKSEGVYFLSRNYSTTLEYKHSNLLVGYENTKFDIFFISQNTSEEPYKNLLSKFPKIKQVNITSGIHDAYKEAASLSTTSMFWVIWDDVVVHPDFKFNFKVRRWNTKYIHVFKNAEYYDGICLFPKLASVSKRELEYRFFANKKEINVQASMPTSPYEKYNINTYDEYLEISKETSTNMFWVIPNNVKLVNNFDFTYQVPKYDQHITHVFRNGEYYDGVCLFSKHNPITKREFDNRFFINKKEINILASTPLPFDVIFISYNEINADVNYKRLLLKVPTAKRIHGVKGIHNAHIEAAKIANTSMFWVVDGDAEIAEDFEFNFAVPQYDHDVVHVWKSQNPVNGLVYGNGGVKLLPTKLTMNVDVTSTDMTTSISSKFKAIDKISNINRFNTDPFTTWRSAFRECAKLASKSIRGQVDEETTARLNAWRTLNDNVVYGFYAYSGALAGQAYGQKNASDKEALRKINDFSWLQDQWSLEKSQLSL